MNKFTITIERELENILLESYNKTEVEKLLKASQNDIVLEHPEVVLYFTKRHSDFTLSEIFEMISLTLDKISCRMQTYQEIVDKKIKNYNRGLLLTSEVVKAVLDITDTTHPAYREIFLKEVIKQLYTSQN